MTRFAEVFIPDGDEARELAEEELSRTIYAEAKPTLFDIWARDFVDFLLRIFSGGDGGASGAWWAALAVVLVIVALLAALLIWGLPRRSRAVRRQHDDLLGASDTRTAAQLRGDAERHARSGDWDEAIPLRYRALARSLIERDLIDPAPGATAQAIAREAGASFPDEREPLTTTATLFDRVRYLALPGDEDDYRTIADLDDRLRREQPVLVPA